MLVYVCSSNPGKLKELEAAAGDKLQLARFPNLSAITPPEETGTTFEANARLKALYYSRLTTEAVLCDDSGLEVDALYGRPGVYSARFAGEGATDQDNNNLLLSELGNLAVRTARFVSVVALARTGKVMQMARGSVEGVILAAPRGTNGFGYDPLFFYPPLNRSFAELSAGDKLSVSHRGRAMRALLDDLQIR